MNNALSVKNVDNKLMLDPFNKINSIDKVFNTLWGSRGLTQFFDNTIDDLFNKASAGVNFPKWEISTLEDGSIVLEMALAGYSKELLSVSIDGNALVITAKKDENENHHKVIAHRAFVERFTLGSNLDTERAKATYKDGLLSIKIPLLAQKVKRELLIG